MPQHAFQTFSRSPLNWLGKLWRCFGPVPLNRSPQFIDRTPSLIELRWIGAPHVFDTRLRTVSRNGRVVLRFDVIRSIDIQRFTNDDCSGLWRICLKTGGVLPGECLGQTLDEVDASTVAARVAGLTGRPVRAL